MLRFRAPRPAAASFAALLAAAQPPAQDAPSRVPVPFHAVRVESPFWAARIERNRAVAIPHSFAQNLATQRIANFRHAAARLRGEEPGPMTGYFFNDSDVYKTIEGAALELRRRPDAALEARCDEVIDAIAAAQEPDGYLYTSRTILDPRNMPPGGAPRWSNMADGHELYCAGHLYEAAVAYAEATGKTKLLEIATKNAMLVAATFGPGKDPHPCGHPEIELGLLRLWQHSGERRWFDLAHWFVDARGRGEGRTLYGDYAQDSVPVVEAKAIVGHAVRAAYLYAAVTDLARHGAGAPYLDASRRLWEDMAASQVYVTGGIGSQGSNEGFGDRFVLPNQSGYSETCASIANALWSHRLFLLTGEARYLDMVERVLFNAFHSGWSLSGDRFFYPNPLSSRGAERQSWFACACCPPNVNRFVPQIAGLAFATARGSLFVCQFVDGATDVEVDGVPVSVRLRSGYPWQCELRIELAPKQPVAFALRIRIPGWCRHEPLPGGLYRFAGESDADPGVPARRLTVNGEEVRGRADHGFAVVDRTWRAGDVVAYSIPMPTARVLCDERVASNRDLVALQRGPLVYCFEGVDHGGADVGSFVLDDGAPLAAEHRPELLGGVAVVRTRVRPVARRLDGGVATGEPIEAQAIPYFAWANRGRTPMAVWLARTPDRARPAPAPTLARRSAATSSFARDLDALSDQDEPQPPDDAERPRVHWWPKKGSAQWVQYDFPEPALVHGVEVSWFDDTGRGECRVPASWRVLARIAGEWREVDAPSGYATDRDRACRTTFAPVRAEGLRLEIESQPGAAGGLHEWRVLEGDGGR
jgi:hypothetical protein